MWGPTPWNHFFFASYSFSFSGLWQSFNSIYLNLFLNGLSQSFNSNHFYFCAFAKTQKRTLLPISQHSLFFESYVIFFPHFHPQILEQFFMIALLFLCSGLLQSFNSNHFYYCDFAKTHERTFPPISQHFSFFKSHVLFFPLPSSNPGIVFLLSLCYFYVLGCW